MTAAAPERPNNKKDDALKRFPLLLLLWLYLCFQMQAQVYDLRCNGLRQPLGLENTTPRFSWKNTLKHNGQRQTAYELQVGSDSAAIADGNGANLWASGKVMSAEQVLVDYHGLPLTARQLCYWRVRTWDEHGKASRWSPVERFAIGPINGIDGEYIGHQLGDSLAKTPYFFKYISVDLKKGQPVFAHVNSLGYHTLYVNGKKVDDKILQPAVSQLDKHSYIVTYDITPYLRKDHNTIIILCGQGWYRQKVFNIPYDGPLVKAEISQLVDGQWQTVDKTDNSWDAWTTQYSYTGTWLPLQFGGECHDGSAIPEWSRAKIFEVEGMHATPQIFEGNHIIDTLFPKTEIPQGDSAVILDFGRVITGWLSVRFDRMNKGDTVLMEYADHLSDDGLFVAQGESDVKIAEGPKDATTFGVRALSADSLEHFQNMFHHHSFRFVRISGARIKESKALQISALNPESSSTFACSDERLNGVHDLVQYTLQNLTFSGYMVDCPHLERMGYGGDGNSSTMTLQTMYDVLPTYYNWLRAWVESMDEDGGLAYVAPSFPTGGGPYWSGFIVKAPWRTYLNYRDSKMVETYYEYGKRWLGYVEKYCVDGLLQPWPDTKKRMWFLGDWLAPEGVDMGGESILHVNNCFLSECYGDMEKMAKILHQDADAQMFAERKAQLKAAIHHKFYHPETHTYANGTPIDQCYALLMNIPPDSATAARVKAQLLEDCYGKYKAHIAVGLMGVPIFTEWCIRERQAELMATILRQSDYPGYWDMIIHGATSTWESWDGERSHVHNCYNGIGTWFYQAMAGIRPDENAPGYRHFFIDPQPVSGVDWVQATKPTPYGDIWVKIVGDRMMIIVPVGTTATVFPGTAQERELPAGQWRVKVVR